MYFTLIAVDVDQQKLSLSYLSQIAKRAKKTNEEIYKLIKDREDWFKFVTKRQLKNWGGHVDERALYYNIQVEELEKKTKLQILEGFTREQQKTILKDYFLCIEQIKEQINKQCAQQKL